VFLAGWNCIACGSSDRPGSALGSAGLDINGSGGGLGLNLGGNGSGGRSGTELSDACAAKISTAQATPLDMFIMLDTSGSMLGETATQVTKWDAVKLALESFLTDTKSAGLGVGLQYFPIVKPNAPTSCSSDAECGDSAPCFLKFCWNSTNLYPCQADKDCLTATGDDAGPCTPIAFCANAQDYVCNAPGKQCDMDRGTCELLGTSICEHTTSCDVALYKAPAAPIAALPGAAAALMTSIDAQMPAGDTPTGPALTGAIQQASAWATAHPDHRVVTVLATDGVPTECTPNAIDAVAALARAGVTATPSISTFVIGVFGPDDIIDNAPTNLDKIAQQGGTTRAFLVDTQKDVTTQFQSALDAIRGARLACQYQIPEPTSGGTLDYGQVNVALTNGDQKSVVYYVKNQAACDPLSGGWYYDVEPSAGTPTKIIACPITCTAFEAAPNGASVGIALGCATIIK
jgi:uncharacterized protein YegL